MRVDVLTRLDSRDIPEDTSEIRLVCTLRNELRRLPYFMEFYRKLGVNRFIITDNGSTDGTTEYLLAQPDCHVLYTEDPYKGVVWQSRVLDLYGRGNWCLVVDSDEFLVYPHSDKMNLREFCTFLDHEGSEGIYTFMVDMYSKGNLSQAVYKSGQNPLEVCPYHDREYKFVDRPFLDTLKLPGRPPCFPKQEVVGGPRARVFYPFQNSTSVLHRVLPRLVGIAVKPLVKLGIISKGAAPHMASLLFKIPLVKWREGLTYYSSTHIMTPIRLSDATGVLLHFKYFSDFYEKALLESKRGVYNGGGRQYKRYASGIQKRSENEHLFYYDGSVEYKGSDELVRLGLIKSTKELDALAHSLENNAESGTEKTYVSA